MVKIENLGFYYKKGKIILEDINATIPDGRIVGLLGKNGIGKSTLLHLLSGLQFPKQGNISVNGFVPKKRQVDFLKDIFLLNEELPKVQISIKRFEELNACFYPKFQHEQFEKYLNLFEIEDNKQKIDNLSYGTRKKIFISFALATNVKLCLMDEPTNGLDIPSKSVFRKILQLSMKDNKTIIISTHQARDLQNILDSIIILDKQSLLLNATDNEITQHLFFGIAKGDENEEDILYSEPSINGNQIVRLNTNNEESNLDVELLFNSVFANKEKFKKAFNAK